MNGMKNGRMKIELMILALMVIALGGTTGCMRVNAFGKSERINAPLSQPRPVDKLKVPLVKDPTKVYRIGPSDVVRVDVRKDPTLSLDYVVTDEGNILLPNIGSVKVANMTAAEVEQALNNVLAEYIREPGAKVAVREYRSKVIYVVGQVQRPGPQVMKADMLTLQDAIFSAGLPTREAAIQRAHVISPALENATVRQIDLAKIIYRGQMAENILLKPNDIVYVPTRYFTNVWSVFTDFLTPIREYYDIKSLAEYSSGDDNGDNGNNNGNDFPLSVLN